MGVPWLHLQDVAALVRHSMCSQLLLATLDLCPPIKANYQYHARYTEDRTTTSCSLLGERWGEPPNGWTGLSRQSYDKVHCNCTITTRQILGQRSDHSAAEWVSPAGRGTSREHARFPDGTGLTPKGIVKAVSSRAPGNFLLLPSIKSGTILSRSFSRRTLRGLLSSRIDAPVHVQVSKLQ